MNISDLNTVIIRTTHPYRPGKPEMDLLDSVFEATGLPFRRMTKVYSKSEIKTNQQLLAEVQRSFHPIPRKIAVSTFLGRKKDQQAFFDAINNLLRKQKAELDKQVNHKA